MIFESLYAASKRGELLLVPGGICHWHLRRDGQLTILEIIATRRGAGSQMLTRLRRTVGATCMVAKCPVDLASNGWWGRRGFTVTRVETSRSKRLLNVWRLEL